MNLNFTKTGYNSLDSDQQKQLNCHSANPKDNDDDDDMYILKQQLAA